MNTRVTLILSFIMLAIAVIYFFDVRNETSKDEKKRADSVIFSVEYSKVKSLSVFRKGQLLNFEKKDGLWYMTSPEQALASAGVLDNLLDFMSGLRIEETIDAQPHKLSDFGLQPPSMLITLKSETGQQVLMIGIKNFSQLSYYAKKENLPDVFTVSNFGISEFEKPYDAFLEKGAMLIAPDSVFAVSVSKKSGSFNLEKDSNFWSEFKGEQEWNIVSPFRKKADYRIVEDFLWTLKDTRVESVDGKFIGKIPRDADDVIAKITVRRKGLADESLTVLSKDSGFFKCLRASTGDLVNLKADAFEKILALTAEYFVDRHLLSFDSALLNEITVFYNEGAQKVNLMRAQSGGWEVVHADSAVKDFPAANTLLWKLESLSALPEVNDNFAGVSPYAKISLKDRSGTIAGEFEFLKSAKGDYAVKISGELYAVKGDELFELLSSINKSVLSKN